MLPLYDTVFFNRFKCVTSIEFILKCSNRWRYISFLYNKSHNKIFTNFYFIFSLIHFKNELTLVNPDGAPDPHVDGLNDTTPTCT